MFRLILACLALVSVDVRAKAQNPAPPDGPAPFLRVSERDEGKRVALEVAIREMTPPKPEQPVVYLVGAVHIGDRAFYDALQAFLDEQQVVLFEGVKPPGTGDAAHDGEESDAALARKSERRVRFLGTAAEHYRKEHGEFPASLEAMAEGVDRRLATLVEGSRVDGWGRAIAFSVSEANALQIVSLGADGAEGGQGVNRDLRFADQKPLSQGEKGEGEGLQQQLASAMGLVFQLDAMNHDGEHWRNSDMSLDQVQQRLDESGAGVDVLSMLDGGSMMSKLATGLLRLVSAMPGGQAMLKLMMVEVLSRADEMIAMMPGEMEELFKVLIHDRNAVVMDDLQKIIESEPGTETVGIIYGAGHLPDLQDRLEAMGYTPGADRWNAAIGIDCVKEGLPPAQVKQMRGMLRRAIDQQLKAATRKK